jgi:hypothetical protein
MAHCESLDIPSAELPVASYADLVRSTNPSPSAGELRYDSTYDTEIPGLTEAYQIVPYMRGLTRNLLGQLAVDPESSAHMDTLTVISELVANAEEHGAGTQQVTLETTEDDGATILTARIFDYPYTGTEPITKQKPPTVAEEDESFADLESLVGISGGLDDGVRIGAFEGEVVVGGNAESHRGTALVVHVADAAGQAFDAKTGLQEVWARINLDRHKQQAVEPIVPTQRIA